jgi:hypothetical protein
MLQCKKTRKQNQTATTFLSYATALGNTAIALVCGYLYCITANGCHRVLEK